MLYAWGGIEMFEDPQYLIKLAGEVDADAGSLSWYDWHTLQGDSVDQDIGGIVGCLNFTSIDSDEIKIVLALAQLFNIGKSASYGCGAFEICSFD